MASSLIGEGDGFPPNLKSLFNSLSGGRDTTELGFRRIDTEQVVVRSSV